MSHRMNDTIARRDLRKFSGRRNPVLSVSGSLSQIPELWNLNMCGMTRWCVA